MSTSFAPANDLVDRAVRDIKGLIYDNQEFALMGAVGIPTSKAVAPIVSDAKIPFLFKISASPLL